jgi:CheY-like chemotaxis protein
LASGHDGDDEGSAEGAATAFLHQWSFLVIDDNPAALAVLRSMLLLLGTKPPLEALDGPQAMELVRAHEFDCIITDVRMEPMSGAEFVRWVRRSNEAASATVRILAMSAYRDGKEVATLATEGANGFVTKPLSLALLRAALSAISDNPLEFVELVAAGESGETQVRRRFKP